MKTISKSQYLLLKMRENYETNLKNETVEITDEEYDNLIQYKNIKYDNDNLEGARLEYEYYKRIKNIIYGENSYPYENSVYLLDNGYDYNDWFIVFNDGTFKRIDNSELIFKLKNNIGELRKYKNNYYDHNLFYDLYYIYPNEMNSNIIHETVIASYKGLTCEYCDINIYKNDYSFNFENQKVYTGPIPTNFLNEYIESNEYSNVNELRIYIDNYSIYIRIYNNDGISYYTLIDIDSKYVIQNNEIIPIEGVNEIILIESGNFKITNFVIDDSHFEGYIEYNNETYQFNLSILKSQSPIVYDNNDDNNFYYVYARGNRIIKIWDNLGNENIGNNFASLTYNRTDEDQHITVYATAQENGKEISDVVSHEYIISSNKHNEKTNEPTILDPTYANGAISFEIIGNGVINAWDNIGNTYTDNNSLNISYNRTNEEQYITVYATAQEDGKDISYTVSRGYTIPSLSNIKTNAPFINSWTTREGDHIDIWSNNYNNVMIHYWDNIGNENESHRIELFYNRTNEDQYITLYVTAQEDGKEISDIVTYEFIVKSFINYSIEDSFGQDLSQSTIKENKPYSWSTPTIVEQFKNWIIYTDELHNTGYIKSNNLALETKDLYCIGWSNEYNRQKIYAPYKLYDDPILGITESSEKCDLIILKNKYYIWDYSNYKWAQFDGDGPILEFPSDIRIIEYDPQTLELSEVNINEERIKPSSYKDNEILYINDFDILFGLNKNEYISHNPGGIGGESYINIPFIQSENKLNYKYFIGNKGQYGGEYGSDSYWNNRYNLTTKSFYDYVNIVGNAYKYEYILNEGDIVILDKNLITINTESFINTEFILDENGNPLQDENGYYTGEIYEHEYKFIPDELKGKITFYEFDSETFELTELNIE